MGRHRFDPSKAHHLDHPERRKQLPPEKILQELQIRSSDTVLDLGAGTGYFTIPAAQMTEKVVYALDVEPRMLDLLEENVRRSKLTNVHLLPGTMENIPLESQSVDKVIASLVLHETDQLEKTLQEIRRVLRSGGTMLIVEWEKHEMEDGPPLTERISVEEMKEAIRTVGMEIQKCIRESHYYRLIAARSPNA